MSEQRERRRPTVGWLVAGAVALAIGLAGTAYVYLGGKSLALTVCHGDARDGCANTEHWIDCGTDPIAWARKVRADVCVNVSIATLATKPGGQCGYRTLAIKCTSR